MMLRGTRVLARCDAQGQPVTGTDGRIEIRYKPQDGRAYRAGKSNLEPVAGAELLADDACAPAADAPAKAGPARKAVAAKQANSRTHADDAVVVYADGACSGNPGPAGLGVVIQDKSGRRELSLFIGEATNNIAELRAILEAAQVIEGDSLPVRIHTDSRYSIGVLSQGWKAKANVELIAACKQALKRFTDLELIYVPGHSGVILNERADVLAVQAVKSGQSSGWKKY
ncbi:MAG TPA: ribonuclease H [Polyangiales bacterium]